MSRLFKVLWFAVFVFVLLGPPLGQLSLAGCEGLLMLVVLMVYVSSRPKRVRPLGLTLLIAGDTIDES